MAKWRWGEESGAGSGLPGPRHFLRPKAQLGHRLAPPPPGHGQISNWKRPLNV